MQAFLERAGVLAPLVFMAIQAVQVVIPILPGAIGCVFGVVFFGAVKGFFYNYIGICIGSVAAFLLARACGQDLVQQMTGAKFYQKYSKYLLQEKQFERIFALLIFLPVAPEPRDLSRRPSEAAVIPLPKDETTPPVTNTCLVILSYLRFP